MSNYPPGVTGREVQIAGMPEGRVFVECRGTSDRPVMAHDDRWFVDQSIGRIEATLLAANDADPGVQATLMLATQLAKEAVKLVGLWKTAKENERLVEMDCGFEGEVDAQLDDEYAYADCPRCGEEIVFEHGLFEPDPDRDRDE